MNINNIKVGDIYKSYRQLCESLEIKPTGGSAKKHNLSELSRFYDFHTEGNKYIIDNKKEIPIPPKIKKSGGNRKQIDPFTDLIIMALSKQESSSITVSNKSLIQLFGMVNSNFFTNYNSIKAYSEHISKDCEVVSDIFQYSYSKLTGDVKRCLKKLQSMSLIHIRPLFIAVEEYEEEVGNKIVTKEITRELNNNEISYILDCEYQAMEDLNIRGKYQLGTNWHAFNSIALKYVRERYKFKKYYKLNNIVLANKALKIESNKSQQRLLTQQMNNITYKTCYKGLENRHKNSLKKVQALEEQIKNLALGVSTNLEYQLLEAKNKAACNEDYLNSVNLIMAENIRINDLGNIENLELETFINIDLDEIKHT